jgi:hypothetical protein
MHPFWTSLKKKRPWMEISMEGGHSQTLSSMGRPWGARQRGKRDGEGEKEQGRARLTVEDKEGVPWGSCMERGSAIVFA